MHDETLDKGKPAYDGDMLREKYILETGRALAKHYKITEDRAMIALGYAMQFSDEFNDVKTVIINLDIITKKPMELMSNDEKQAMIAIGHLVRKIKPFKSETKNIGRNDLCPCDSGKKFKSCCLNVAKLNEVERHKNGR